MASPFQKLEPLPIEFAFYLPRPCQYPQDSNCVIISTSSSEDNAGIYAYNMDSNEIDLLHEYSGHSSYSEHGQFIDYKNEILLLLGGDGSAFDKYNLITNTMTDKNDDNDEYKPTDDLYSKAVQISESRVYYLISKIIIYISSTKQLMIPGGDDNDKIYVCQIEKDQEMTGYEWQLYSLVIV